MADALWRNSKRNEVEIIQQYYYILKDAITRFSRNENLRWAWDICRSGLTSLLEIMAVLGNLRDEIENNPVIANREDIWRNNLQGFFNQLMVELKAGVNTLTANLSIFSYQPELVSVFSGLIAIIKELHSTLMYGGNSNSSIVNSKLQINPTVVKLVSNVIGQRVQ